MESLIVFIVSFVFVFVTYFIIYLIKYKKGTIKELPSREAIDVPVNETLIVEFYSK